MVGTEVIQTVWCVCAPILVLVHESIPSGGEKQSLGRRMQRGEVGVAGGKKERGGLATKGGMTHDYAVCAIKRIRLSPIFFPSTSGRLRQTKPAE